MMITIGAAIFTDGAHRLYILTGDRSVQFRQLWNSRGDIDDWQSVVCDEVDLRSVMMTLFGIKWYNIGRAKIAQLEGAVAEISEPRSWVVC
jgi:hypothetical protein